MTKEQRLTLKTNDFPYSGTCIGMGLAETLYAVESFAKVPLFASAYIF